jgi:actin-related protein
VQNILDERMAKYNAITGEQNTMDCVVDTNMVQGYAVWFGGSVLGANPLFTNYKTRAMYEEMGPKICRGNAIFND